MDFLNRVISLLRREGQMGKYIRQYEESRYTEHDRVAGNQNAIIVPADSDQFADVSFWQGLMDWIKYFTKSFYAIIRISQNTWIDREFENNYVNGHARGVKQGGYVFYDDRVSPQSQANTVLAALNGRELEGHLVVDWETNYGGQYFGLKYVVDLIKILKASNVKCKGYLIYTGYYFFTGNSSATSNAAEYRYITDNNIGLWIAWYANASYVKIPAPWTDWVYWQYGTPAVGFEWGAQSAEIDMNYSNGKLDLGGTEPPDGGSVTTTGIAEERQGRSPSIRDGASKYATKVGSFPPYSTIEFFSFVRDVNGVDWWIKLTETEEKYVNLEVDGIRYLVVTRMPGESPEPPEPPSGVADVPFSITLGDDVTYEKHVVSGTLKAIK